MYGALAPAALAAAMFSHHGSVTVQPGDTLSGLAARWCGSAAAWPGLAAASRITTPDHIVPGERVTLGCHAAPPARLTSYTVRRGGTDGDGDHDADQGDGGGPAQGGGYQARHARGGASFAGVTGFERCVIARESGGSATIVNPRSGAGGLYQFLPSTWARLGFSGLPQYAPVAVQRAAFLKAVALDGTSDWAPYDGC